MAIARFPVDGYGQLELNQVTFRRTGRIEAQCKLVKSIDFVENGMLLAVDKAKNEIKLPGGENDKLVGLNYTTEHMYDEREQALKNFRLDNNTFLPRIGFLTIGDRFTTNCLAYDDSEFTGEGVEAQVKALKAAIKNCATTPVYGCECENGAIKVTKVYPASANVVLQAVKETTMPDGQYAVKFVALK